MLLAGPALSAAASLLLFAAPAHGLALPFVALFLVGFGPMMWLICQTGVRQNVTPATMLGRVGASLEVANDGVRPLGAIAAAGFAASFAVALVSDLAQLRQMPDALAG